MAALGSLVVKLALEYAEYTKGLDKGSQDALKFAQGVQKSFGTATASVEEFFTGLATGALAAVGAYAGISASLDRVSHSIDLLAQLDDAAQKTGASIENLSKMQGVAEEFGHDFGQIESMLLKLSKGMATFDSETNYTNRALKALGVESRDAAGKLRDPAAVMSDSIKRLQDYEDGAAKSALAMDLFGKSGADALPILNDLADNMDRFSPVSAEAAAKAAQFQDQLGAIRTRVDDAFMSLTQGLLPSLLRVTETTHDAGDGMNFFSRAGEAVGRMIERLLGAASYAQMVFSQLGDTVVTRGRQFQALIKGDFHEIGQLEKNLSMLRDKSLAEHQAYVKRISGGEKELVESAEKVKKTLSYQTGTQSGESSSAASEYERATKAATDYITRLQQETEAIGLNAAQVKLLAAARAAAAAPLESQRVAIMASAQAWAEATVAQEENAAAAKRLEAEEKKRLDGYAALVQADEKSLESLKQKNDLLEYGSEAVAKMGQADLQAALDRAWAADNIDVNVINMLERRLELSKQLAAEAKRGEALEAARDAAKEASRAWENTARDINRSLTDALLRGFESGKSFAQNLRDTIKHMFQTLILRPIIDVALSPVSRSIMSMMGGAGGIGVAGPAAASGVAGMSGAAGTGMLSGLMTTMGPALAAAGAAFAIGSLTSSFGAGKKIFGIKGDSPLNFIAPIVGILAGLFGKGPKQLGPAELTGNFAEDGFHGEFQADWTRKVGMFGGKKRGRRGLGITSDQLEGVNSTLFGIMDVFDSLADTAGDATRSLSGWNFAVKQQIETEEQRAQLAKDLADSLGAHLIPELVDLQQTGESLADTAARVQAEYVLVNAALDLTGQRLNQIGLASIGLRDNLVQLLGGLQNAGSLLQPFFENFYTDAERAASTGRLMNAELAKLGVSIPTTREQFRALVEAQDLNTDAGQQMFAALLRLAPAFASVTDAIGQAAAEAEAEAKRILDSMQVLKTDAFKTAFEYTRYMRLAANAGVAAAQPAQVFQAPPAQVFPSFAVGTNSLPHDMTINAHAGERIIPAADNRELMAVLQDRSNGMQVLVEEIRRLREENKAQALAIARNTAAAAKDTSKLLRVAEDWNVEGLPAERA